MSCCREELALDELQEKRPGSDYYFGLVSAFLGQHGPLPDQADGLLIIFLFYHAIFMARV